MNISVAESKFLQLFFSLRSPSQNIRHTNIFVLKQENKQNLIWQQQPELPIAIMAGMKPDIMLLTGSMYIVIAPVIPGPSSFKATGYAQE